MKKTESILLILIILINTMFSAGCWNYREIDKFSIVAGVAIDKGMENQFQMTVEIAEVSGGKESKTKSKIITTEGKTLFDAARNLIALCGEKLYWAHAKVIILSKEIANEGVSKVLEWYNRDAETRENVYILISKMSSAKEILNAQISLEDIQSFELYKSITNQSSLSKAPTIDILKFDIESKTKGISTVIPSVNLEKINGKIIPQVMGAAIIKKDKLIGFLNGEDTKNLNFIRNDVKGGLLNEEIQQNALLSTITLEIFKSKTKVTPVVNVNNIKINLNIDTTVSIGEIDNANKFLDDGGWKSLEQNTENNMNKSIESLIQRVKLEYDADIFGFASKLQEDKIGTWNKISDNWDETFKDLKVTVNTRVHIKNSAVISKSSIVGE